MFYYYEYVYKLCIGEQNVSKIEIYIISYDHRDRETNISL